MILRFRGLLFDVSVKELELLRHNMSLVRQGFITKDQAIIDTLKRAGLIHDGLSTQLPREGTYGTHSSYTC